MVRHGQKQETTLSRLSLCSPFAIFVLTKKTDMPKSILFALLLLVATTAYGRRTVDTYFISAPTQLLPQLDANNRKDLIDLFDAGLESRITGPLGGNIEIGSIDDRQITVHFSPASTLQIALLPTADTVGVIAVIHTVDLPAPDSRITFYDTQWKPIENNELFIAPTPETFLSKGSKKEKRQAAGLIDLLPRSYTIEGNTLLASETLKEYLPDEIYDRIGPLLREKPVAYRWTGKRFTP